MLIKKSPSSHEMTLVRSNSYAAAIVRLLPFDSFNNHFLHVLSYVILLPLGYEFAGIIYWIVL